MCGLAFSLKWIIEREYEMSGDKDEGIQKFSLSELLLVESLTFF